MEQSAGQRRFATLAAAMILAVCGTARAVDDTVIRVLLLTGQNNHDWRSTTPVLVDALEASGRFRVTTTEHPETLQPASLTEYDAVLSNWNTFGKKAAVQAWPAPLRAAFMDYVRAGHGFVVVHAGGSMFYDWPEFQSLVASWGPRTGHGHPHPFQVEIADPAHPITTGLKPFITTDELWHRTQLGTNHHVLATAFSDAASGGSGTNEPVAWAAQVGKGRCFNLVLGHDAAAMRNTGFQLLLTRGTEWAATGRVAIPNSAIFTGRVDALIREAATYRFGQSRAPLAALEQLVFDASAEDADTRHATAAALAVALRAEQTTPDARDAFCRLLGRIGSNPEIPVLAPLLLKNDKRAALSARIALEAIPGTAASDALRDALRSGHATDPTGLIDSIGARGDCESVELLVPLIAATDPSVAGAACDALGRISGQQAAEALADAHPAAPTVQRRLAGARLRCAEERLRAGDSARARSLLDSLMRDDQPAYIRRAAFPLYLACTGDAAGDALLRALGDPDPAMQAAAVGALRDTGNPAVIRMVCNQLPTLNATIQVPIIALLGERGDAAARPAVLGRITAEDDAVRQAAISALGSLGDATCVPPLVAALSREKGALRQATQRSLTALLGGSATDDALLNALATADDNAKPELLKVLEARGATSAVPALLRYAANSDKATARAALHALGALGDAQTGRALARALAATDAPNRTAAEGALAAICRRIGDCTPVIEAMPGASSAESRASLIGVLGAVGGGHALARVRAALRETNEDVRTAAVRALAAWPDAKPLEQLSRIACDPTAGRRQILALRGVARLVPLATERPMTARFAMLDKALAAAARPEEKRALLAALSTIPTPEALATARGEMADPALASEAAQTILALAPPLAEAHLAAVSEAVRTILAGDATRTVHARAAEVAVQLGLLSNLAQGAAATSPDELDADGAAGGDAAAIDGNPNTYWDETDNQKLYRLAVTLKQSATVYALRITGYRQQEYAPKDFEVICDGKMVRRIEGATYEDNRLLVTLPPTRCRSVELKISAYYAKSPAIRELEILGSTDGNGK